MKRDLEIRPAHPSEAATLTEIAVEAKSHWGYDEVFMDRFAEVIVLDPGYMADNDVWVLEVNGQIVGFHGLIHHGNVSELDHLWLLPEHIGRGFGGLLFKHALIRAKTHGSSQIEWEAEPNAVGFYRHMGGVEVRKTTSQLGRRLQVFAVDVPTGADRQME